MEEYTTEREWHKNETYRELFDRVQILSYKIFSITGWLTNVSLALIGFHIALLLQLKSNGNEITSYLTIIPLVTLTLSILVGLGLKLWHQMVDISQEFLRLQDESYERIDLSEEEKKEFEEFKASDEEFDKIMSAKLDHLPVFWIGTQLVLFSISILMVSIFVISVLFF